MNSKSQIDRIKSDLAENVGNKVRFASRCGKSKRVVGHGTIEGAYSNVFIISVDLPKALGAKQRLLSYSYADIITHTVELALCGE